MRIISTGLLCVVLFSAIASGFVLKEAPSCNAENCKPPNCRCSGLDIPGGLTPDQTPQFVLLTFDDAVTVVNMPLYREALYERNNPDGCPVAATYFLSHEYTDYKFINELYNTGHEIALHSVTHQTNTDYWKKLDVEGYTKEFVDQRWMISHFANLPADDLKGIRVPFLQTAGDNYTEMLHTQAFTYDCTMPTQRFSSPGMWPYTLDTKSTQDCVIGPCPTESWPGSWVIPMLAWRDNLNIPCSMVDTCVNIPDNVDGLLEFMIRNFNQTYNTNKAPIGFYVHSAWFQVNPVHFEAYKKFLDYLGSLSDVYMVGGSKVIDWIKNPVPLSTMRSSDWSHCKSRTPRDCPHRTCPLEFKQETRYLSICAECPNSYPWLDNAFGLN